MLISIGVLAYNEEKNIGRTLASLFQQSIFTRSTGLDVQWQVIVVPNGCKDATAAVATQALQAEVAQVSTTSVSFVVEPLTKPGKSNAWNELIHRIADPRTEVFVLMDADIEFGHPDTIFHCVQRLLTEPHVRAVVDLPLKDFTRKPKLSLLERLSAKTSKANLAGNVGISGQFYCARGNTLRSVWMPVGLSVEDGFLAAMVITDGFREQPDPTRIVRAADATHYFEGLTRLRDVVQHEVRIVVGSVLNCHLCWDTLMFLTPPDGPGAGAMVKSLNESQPDWYTRMMTNMIVNRGRWTIPRGWVFERFGNWRRGGTFERWRGLPRRVVVLMFDAFVYWLANRKLRSGRAVGYW
jgi:glycosyltransferase involved in cell wall biosynthesis